MKIKPMPRSWLARVLAGAGLAGLFVLPAHAKQLEFDNPDLTGRLDTTLSVGALWRTEGQEKYLEADEDPVVMAAGGYSTQLNKNDANNNFDAGSLASFVTKITPEFSLSWQNKYGLQLSGTYYYDSVIMGGGHDGGILNPSAPFVSNGFTRYATYSQHANNGIGDDFTEDAQRYAGDRGRILDAYVWGDFLLGEMPLNVRLGQQVINWGEALFITGGVNTANYFDLNSLRLPGSEIKEALLPLDSLYFNLGLTLNLTMEAFYQFEWKNNFDAPVGTFFSTHDAFPGEGADNVIVDGRLAALSNSAPGLETAFANYTLNTYGQSGSAYGYEQTQVTVNRLADEEASDSGQFGLGFRYFAQQLNGTEFGLFYTRTHSRLPVVSSVIQDQGPGASIPQWIDNTQYRMVYPEDVDMYGLSFNTFIKGVSVAGELAYRPEEPIINEVGDNLIAALSGAAASFSGGASSAAVTNHCVRAELDGPCLSQGGDGDGADLQPGQEYYFYDLAETYNGSLVSIFNLGPTLGTDGLVTLLEVGVEHVAGLDDKDSYGNDLYYNSTAAISESEAEVQTPDDVYQTYLDDTSWGYRAVIRADYNDFFAGVNFSPSLRLAHDVDGNSPIGGNFMENRKAATLGLTFTYLNNLTVEVTGTSFWGAGYSNKLKDRDNASLSMKYSF
jgi:hypothetical protein